MISDAEFNRILDAGISLWNRHRFFECHDKLEEAWKEVKHERKREPQKDLRRDFVHGLILMAVAYLHWRRGNPVGALRKHAESRRLLQPYPSTFLGIDVERFLARTAEDFARLDAGPQAAYRSRRVPGLVRA